MNIHVRVHARKKKNIYIYICAAKKAASLDLSYERLGLAHVLGCGDEHVARFQNRDVIFNVSRGFFRRTAK